MDAFKRLKIKTDALPPRTKIKNTSNSDHLVAHIEQLKKELEDSKSLAFYKAAKLEEITNNTIEELKNIYELEKENFIRSNSEELNKAILKIEEMKLSHEKSKLDYDDLLVQLKNTKSNLANAQEQSSELMHVLRTVQKENNLSVKSQELIKNTFQKYN